MSIRWTEEEAEKYGYRKDSDGNWLSPHLWQAAKSKTKTDRQSDVSRPAAKSKRAANRKDEGQAEGNRLSKTSNTQSKVGQSPRYVVRIIMYYFRTMDPDNWIYKWYLDDLVHKGFLPGDSTEYIKRIIEEHVKVYSEEEQKTVIEVYQIC